MSVEENVRGPVEAKALLGEWSGAALSRLASLVTDAVLTLDAGRRVRACNRVFLEGFCGSGASDLVGKKFCEVMDCVHVSGGACEGSPTCAYCGWLRAARDAAGGAVAECECRILTSGGRAHDLCLRVAGDGEGLICSMRDLFEAKRLRVLERAFFHDVLNLGVGIKGLAEMADVSDLAQMAEYMCLIQNSAARMVDQVLWLRTLRGAEQGNLSPCVAPVDCGELLEEVVVRCQEDADARHVAIDVACDSGWALETDRELARLVLGTLMQNAVEASRRGDKIRVSADPSGDLADFRIFSAAPLADEVRAQLFQRSFTTKGAGRGVGVYGARLVVEKYLRGRLWFDGDPSAGAIFGVTVPRVWAAK